MANNNTEIKQPRRTPDLVRAFALAAILPLAFTAAYFETDTNRDKNLNETLNIVDGTSYRNAGTDECFYKAAVPLVVTFRAGADILELWTTGNFWLNKIGLGEDRRSPAQEIGQLPQFLPVDCRFAGFTDVKVYRGTSELLAETADDRARIADTIRELAGQSGNTSRAYVIVPN